MADRAVGGYRGSRDAATLGPPRRRLPTPPPEREPTAVLSHRWPVLDRVLVNLLDGRAISGVLLKVHRDLLVLADAYLHEDGADKPTRMDGSVYVERSMVAFIQATPPKGG